jgi:hypothetical protein
MSKPFIRVVPHSCHRTAHVGTVGANRGTPHEREEHKVRIQGTNGRVLIELQEKVIRFVYARGCPAFLFHHKSLIAFVAHPPEDERSPELSRVAQICSLTLWPKQLTSACRSLRPRSRFTNRITTHLPFHSPPRPFTDAASCSPRTGPLCKRQCRRFTLALASLALPFPLLLSPILALGHVRDLVREPDETDGRHGGGVT